MKKILAPILLLLCSATIFFCSSGQSAPAAQSKKIIIIRHGEKPDEGDNLSCQGFNRALQLPAVLYAKFGLPAHVFVPSINTGKKTSTARMYQTVLPFAIKHNLSINSKFDVEDADGLADALKKTEGNSLVVWEHKNINDIARALGIAEKLKWEANDFDSIWIITLSESGAILQRDKEGLLPKADCL